VNNFFTIAKLLPLLAVVIAGSIYLFRAHHSSPVPLMASTSATPGSWLKAILLLVFAYGGFETALTPMAEAKDPRRDTVFALFAALAVCALLYISIQWIVISALPDAAHSERPLADAARLMMGREGAGLIAIGALVSVYGYLSAKILAVPRLTFALAERGDFPSFFAVIHPRFRTPHISILVFALLVWALSLFGSFTWNLTLSAAARLFYYAISCAALPSLRKKQPGDVKFRLPAGNFLAVVGVTICAVLLTQVDRSKSLILVGTVVVAAMNWMWVRTRKPVMK
jgi:amino acid transporter